MIVFGLGNPGLRYRATRHNVGFLFVERLAKQYKKRFRTYRGYKKAVLDVHPLTILLIKPLCYMNESGIAVREILSQHDETFMIVVDDIDLPLGRIRLRAKGGDGGHRGLRSIIEEIGYSDFPRLRIGIGRSGEDPVHYVLSRFKRQERKILHSVLDHGIKGLRIMIQKGMAAAQNYINAINLSEFE